MIGRRCYYGADKVFVKLTKRIWSFTYSNYYLLPIIRVPVLNVCNIFVPEHG